MVLERLQVLRPKEAWWVWGRPLAMVRRVEEVRGHLEHPWVLLAPVSVHLVRRGQGLHRQVLVRRQAILGIRGRVQVLREPEKLLGLV